MSQYTAIFAGYFPTLLTNTNRMLYEVSLLESNRQLFCTLPYHKVISEQFKCGAGGDHTLISLLYFFFSREQALRPRWRGNTAFLEGGSLERIPALN